MKAFTFPQRSPEWWAIRRGIPTASSFDRIITPAKAQSSIQQEGYINELLAEIYDEQYSREPDNAFISGPMADGIDGEPAARSWYAFEHDCEVTEMGFCLSDCSRFGASPDGLIGAEGILELKRPILKTHIAYLRDGGLPLEYKCQCHGLLAVTGYEWLDFVSYSPVAKLDSLIVRIKPDDFTTKLKAELLAFCDRLDAAREKLGLGKP